MIVPSARWLGCPPIPDAPMLRDSKIPLFLWMSVAVLFHLSAGGATTEVVKVLEEIRDMQRFAMLAKQVAGSAGQDIEVTMAPIKKDKDKKEESEETKEEEEEEEESESEEKAKKPKPAKKAVAKKPEPPKPPKPKKAEKKAPPKLVVKKAEKKPEPAKKIELKKQKKIAVEQHVDDKNQKNPDAEFIAKNANRVKEQRQARITSTDQNHKKPTPGGNHSSAADNPGNAEETKVAQSEERPGADDKVPAPRMPSQSKAKKTSDRPEDNEPVAKGKPDAPSKLNPQKAQTAQKGQKGQKAQKAMPHVHDSASGADPIARARKERKARRKRRARRARRARRRRGRMFGYGARGTTRNGTNLNLQHGDLKHVVGDKRLALERKLDARRRLSKHRGRWKSVGIERWRSAIENYVPSVKPGNQTALNTARSPFASYLNALHNRLHPVFADSFLASLGSLPNSHPMNQSKLKTFLEIVLSETDGRIVRMGVTKTSGVTAFDIAALESVQRASPYGPPPREIVSPDGNVYLHWEFHRNPYYACSTYFARPYILKVRPKTAPPKVSPPGKGPFDPKEGPPSRDRRTGSRDRKLEKRTALR